MGFLLEYKMNTGKRLTDLQKKQIKHLVYNRFNFCEIAKYFNFNKNSIRRYKSKTKTIEECLAEINWEEEKEKQTKEQLEMDLFRQNLIYQKNK